MKRSNKSEIHLLTYLKNIQIVILKTKHLRIWPLMKNSGKMLIRLSTNSLCRIHEQSLGTVKKTVKCFKDLLTDFKVNTFLKISRTDLT